MRTQLQQGGATRWHSWVWGTLGLRKVFSNPAPSTAHKATPPPRLGPSFMFPDIIQMSSRLGDRSWCCRKYKNPDQWGPQRADSPPQEFFLIGCLPTYRKTDTPVHMSGGSHPLVLGSSSPSLATSLTKSHCGPREMQQTCRLRAPQRNKKTSLIGACVCRALKPGTVFRETRAVPGCSQGCWSAWRVLAALGGTEARFNCCPEQWALGRGEVYAE